MFERMLKKLANACWFIPGVLLWASFPPMQEKTDVLFALAPLMWLARNSGSGKSCRLWFLNGLVFWVATLAWMPAIVKNGGPWPLVVLGWFVLACYLSLYFLAFGFLSSSYWTFARGRSYLFRLAGILLVEPVLWGGLELVRSNLFGGFAWNFLGVAQVSNLPVIQFASIAGVYGVSMLVILVNGSITCMTMRMASSFLQRLPGCKMPSAPQAGGVRIRSFSCSPPRVRRPASGGLLRTVRRCRRSLCRRRPALPRQTCPCRSCATDRDREGTHS